MCLSIFEHQAASCHYGQSMACVSVFLSMDDHTGSRLLLSMFLLMDDHTGGKLVLWPVFAWF
jgi:hypothetical protein